MGGCLSVRSHLAVSSAVCSNLRTRSQTQAQAGATEGLIVKVRFNKTVWFSLGVGGGVWGRGEAGLSEDHRRSGGRLKPGASAAG